MRRRARRQLTLLALASVLAGCAFGPAAEPAATQALLDQLPAQVPTRATGAATLLVFPPEGRPAIDSTQMAYSLRPHHIAYYAHNQWAETPPQMLQPLLVRTMEATGAFRAVLSGPYSGAYGVGLRAEIVELVQDFAQDPPQLRLTLRARLSEGSSNRLLATREISVREPMRHGSPQAGVAAANEATARALQQLAGFVLENSP